MSKGVIVPCSGIDCGLQFTVDPERIKDVEQINHFFCSFECWSSFTKTYPTVFIREPNPKSKVIQARRKIR